MGVPINNVTRRVVYAASGTGPYNFTFEILAAGDIAVYKDDALLTLTTDYSVTINSNGTGFVTLTATPTGATQIAIVGNRTISRTTDFVTGGDFFANTLNDELDQQTIFNQQNSEGLSRALQAPQTDPTSINMTLPRASLRANKALGFDANGNPAIADTLGTNRGNWAAATLYYVRDIVKDTTNNNIWQCITQHTSTGSQPINTNTDAAKWTLLVDAASATTSATNAANSASAAATSASNASTSATNASNSATLASEWASKTNGQVASTDYSSKAWAVGGTGVTDTSSRGAAKEWATKTSGTVDTSEFSAKEYSQGSQSGTGGSAKNWAQQTGADVTGASANSRSAKSWAQDALTGATLGGSSKDWAQHTGSTVDGTNYSAKYHATAAASSASAASSSASAAATSETNAAASAASAAAALDSFDDRYLGAKTADPTVDNDGNALVTGALYYRTTTPVGMKVYDGAQWLEASAAQQSLMVTYEFVATAGQTTFSGLDANGATLSYVANSISVSLNGVTLRPGDDYTATNGTSVVLNVAAALNDDLMVIAFAVFNVANAVAKTGDTMTGSLLLPAGTVSAPALTTSADTNTGIFFPAADTIAFSEGGVESMRIDSAGNVGIGTSSPDAKLRINGSATVSSQVNVAARIGASVDSDLLLGSVNGNTPFVASQGAFPLAFYTNATERARIDSSGIFLIAKTASSGASTGAEFQSGTGGNTAAFLTASGAPPLIVNRQAEDGTLVSLRQANTEEGSISVSGATVSYNAFAGSHWSQLQDGSKPEILRGTVMESIDELVQWPDEPTTERLCRSKVSDTAGSKRVYGVFMNWDNDWTATNDMLVTSLGAFICRVSSGVTVQMGDLLESNGDGTARVQADDIIRSSTIGKVTSTVKTHEYDDGSYCVPTVLYCG
jgi:hypothetical protein